MTQTNEFVLTMEVRRAVERAELLRGIMPRNFCERYVAGRDAVLMTKSLSTKG